MRGWTVITALSRLVLLLVVLLVAGCAPASSPQASPGPGATSPVTNVTPPPLETTVILGRGQPSDLPVVRERQEQIAAALQAPPYILLRQNLDARLSAAQDAVVADPRVRSVAQTSDGQPLRAEIMTVGEARAGDVPPALSASCPPGSCVRVVGYVYPTNTTFTGLVDDRGQVIDVQTLAGAQPEIPDDLADLAVQIAIHDPQVATAFEGLTPDQAMAAMQATKTALDNTSCERSKHLCVAPVFRWGEQALWTIIDLTDFSLVAATTWTDVGASGGRRVVSEATLEDAAIAPLCETPQIVERDGWKLSYLLTSSDGLELRDITFQGRPILTSAKIVDWQVSYTGSDGQRPGFNDAVGCPVFSQAAVIPYSLPSITDDAGGFVLEQVFRSPNWPQPCNYQYFLRATFSANGALTLLAGNQGRGCGTQGIYFPIVRLEPPGTAQTARWDGSVLTPLVDEGLAEISGGADLGFQFDTEAGPLTVTPAWGDAELAFTYWTQAKPAEGQGDLPSIARVGALDEQQGPHLFVDGEALGHTPVLWWVPRISNAERARCWADSVLDQGMLVAQIWPCSSGMTITQESVTDAQPQINSTSTAAPLTTPAP